MRKELITLSLVVVIVVSAASGYLLLSQGSPTISTTSRGQSSSLVSSSESSGSTGGSTTTVQTTGSITTTTTSFSSSYSTTLTTQGTDGTQTYTATSSVPQTSNTTQTTSYTTSSTSYTTQTSSNTTQTSSNTTQTTYSTQTSYVNSSQTRTFGPNNLPDCGSKTQFFSVPPMNMSDFLGIIPLGNLNPRQHVVPTNHLYFSIRGFNHTQNGWTTAKVPVAAPGNLTLMQISSNNYSPVHTDYKLYFAQCSQFSAYYDHVTDLSPDLQALFAPPFDFCQAYSGGSSGVSCTKFVHIPVQAGEYPGTAGGVVNGSIALDFGAVDQRAVPLPFSVPSHYSSDQVQAVCAIDYYTPTMADTLRSRLGSWDGLSRRITPPVCGSIDQDVVGTAQGNWFGPGTVFPVRDESNAIALVHDNVNASRGVFSIGSYMTNLGFQAGAYYFSPRSSGSVNLDFQYVQPGQVYCYETGPQSASGKYPITVILVQLLDASTLRIEGLPASTASSCGNGPWVFTANYADFQR